MNKFICQQLQMLLNGSVAEMARHMSVSPGSTTQGRSLRLVGKTNFPYSTRPVYFNFLPYRHPIRPAGSPRNSHRSPLPIS